MGEIRRLAASSLYHTVLSPVGRQSFCHQRPIVPLENTFSVSFTNPVTVYLLPDSAPAIVI